MHLALFTVLPRVVGGGTAGFRSFQLPVGKDRPDDLATTALLEILVLDGRIGWQLHSRFAPRSRQ
jgi:hypothetical protein